MAIQQGYGIPDWLNTTLWSKLPKLQDILGGQLNPFKFDPTRDILVPLAKEGQKLVPQGFDPTGMGKAMADFQTFIQGLGPKLKDTGLIILFGLIILVGVLAIANGGD